MDAQERAKAITGRQAVDAYRTAHRQLHSPAWHKGIPEEHMPLLNTLLAGLASTGFSSLNDFFTASEELNIKELGFQSIGDFENRATQTDITALDRMWH